MIWTGEVASRVAVNGMSRAFGALAHCRNSKIWLCVLTYRYLCQMYIYMYIHIYILCSYFIYIYMFRCMMYACILEAGTFSAKVRAYRLSIHRLLEFIRNVAFHECTWRFPFQAVKGLPSAVLRGRKAMAGGPVILSGSAPSRHLNADHIPSSSPSFGCRGSMWINMEKRAFRLRGNAKNTKAKGPGFAGVDLERIPSFKFPKAPGM